MSGLKQEDSVVETARVKEEPEQLVDVSVCIKVEAVVDDEPQHFKPEVECVPVQPRCEVKLETSWQDRGLRTDNKDSKVAVGPALLQRLCADNQGPTTPHGEPPEPQRQRRPRARHVRVIDTYMCDLCGTLYTNKQSLTRHIKIHLRENPKVLPNNSGKKGFFCEICNKMFLQSGHYNRHVLTHAGHKPHVCDICRRRFTRLDCLRIHKRTHTGQKPYSCEFCGKEFTQSHNLTRHIRVHTGIKPYVCDICFKRCTQSGDLKTHKRIHKVGNKAYSCDLCDKMFKKKTEFIKHKRSHRRKNVRDATKKARVIS